MRITEGQSVAVCEYCETQQTLPRLNDDRIADLYDRANHFRRSNDYDKALGMYEKILEENKEDAEAYWSIVLCRYGIEYVEDPQTGKRVPTVNRAQFTSILADSDYQAALRYADILQREIYEREAGYIEEIQKNILRVVENEEPYDVFICYKDKDSLGQPTQDRVIATEIYNRLTRENFKVFFAYVTLDEKLGHEFEPYIFSALQSSKVMIVLGTKPEYFNAVWVKNEWSRYLTLIKSGAKKTLITAFKDMDAYDLPDELSLQAQDMEKMGFIENLVYTVRREVERNTETKQQETDTSTIVIKGSEGSTANLVKLAFMALEDKVWRDANLYFDRVLTADPECGIAYAGKLLAELKLSNLDMLGGYPDSFENRPNYKRALQFADGNLKNILETSLLQVKYRIACQLMELKEYEDALAIFESIAYMDSTDKMSECLLEIVKKKYQIACRLMEQRDYEKALAIFESIDYMDSAAKVVECKQKIDDREFEKQVQERKKRETNLESDMRWKRKELGKEVLSIVYFFITLFTAAAITLIICFSSDSSFSLESNSLWLIFYIGLGFLIFSAVYLYHVNGDLEPFAAFMIVLLLNAITISVLLITSIVHIVKFFIKIAKYKKAKTKLVQYQKELEIFINSKAK